VGRSVSSDDQRKVRDIASGRPHIHALMRMAATEMRAGRFEVWWLALGYLMDVNGVFPWRKILDIDVDFDALGCGRQSCSANALALRILDVHYDGLCGLRVTVLHKNQASGRQKQRRTNGSSHGGSPPSELVSRIWAIPEKLWIQSSARTLEM
jgi:hypothetical protein